MKRRKQSTNSTKYWYSMSWVRLSSSSSTSVCAMKQSTTYWSTFVKPLPWIRAELTFCSPNYNPTRKIQPICSQLRIKWFGPSREEETDIRDLAWITCWRSVWPLNSSTKTLLSSSFSLCLVLSMKCSETKSLNRHWWGLLRRSWEGSALDCG